AMQSKRKEHDSIHHGIEKTTAAYALKPGEFDYGPLGKLPVFKKSHPKVMLEFMRRMNWELKLNYSKRWQPDRDKSKHEKMKYRLLSFLENKVNGGKDFFG